MGSEACGQKPQTMKWEEEIKKKEPYGCLAIFIASWHPPSMNLVKVAEGLQKQYAHLVIITVDVDQSKFR